MKTIKDYPAIIIFAVLSLISITISQNFFLTLKETSSIIKMNKEVEALNTFEIPKKALSKEKIFKLKEDIEEMLNIYEIKGNISINEEQFNIEIEGTEKHKKLLSLIGYLQNTTTQFDKFCIGKCDSKEGLFITLKPNLI